MHPQHSQFPGDVNSVSPPPKNADVEMALLGAILLDNRLIEKVSDFLKPEHFFEPLHGEIYKTAESLIRQGKTASPITLRTYFEGYPDVETEFGNPLPVPQYLARMVANSCVPSSTRDYGQTLRDLATRRQIILAAEDMLAAAYAPRPDINSGKIVDESLSKLFDLAKATSPEHTDRVFADIVTDALADIEATFCAGEGLAGLSTGLRDVDAKLGGLAPSDLIVLAGRPAMGKTALAVNIAVNAAKTGTHVGVFSMEMSDKQLTNRIISERSEVSSDRMRRGKIAPAEWPKIKGAADDISRLPLHIDKTGGLSISQLAMRSRRWHRTHGLGLIVIDYIQLMGAGARRHGDNRTNEITDITTGLKALAKELNVPIIALSQLNRSLENRDDKRPQLSDLRESGSIEQDADVVLFVYRDDYYLELKEPDSKEYEKYADWLAKMKAAVGTAEVIIGKQRHGPTGPVKLAFNKELTRFSDLAREGRGND